MCLHMMLKIKTDLAVPRQWAVLPVLVLLFVLSSTDETSFDLDSIGRMHFLQAKLAQTAYSSCKRTLSLFTASVTFCWSPFFRCLVCNKPKVKYIHSYNQTEYETG